jgi:alpha-1,6-mannosyltransferase
MYSLLPHKEVRFLFPVLPLFNAVAATGLAHVWQLCRQQRSTRLLWHLGASIAALMCLSIVLTALAASHFNYPGGTALQQLHAATQSRATQHLHIETLPAMTGVSRFLESASGWTYTKTEAVNQSALDGYTHVLSTAATLPRFHVLAKTAAFHRVVTVWQRMDTSVKWACLCLRSSVYAHHAAGKH